MRKKPKIIYSLITILFVCESFSQVDMSIGARHRGAPLYDMDANYDEVIGRLINPLPGDESENINGWRLRYVDGICDDGLGDPRSYPAGTFTASYNDYRDLSELSCTQAQVPPEEPFPEKIVWNDLGSVQRPEFGLTTYTCDLINESCDADISSDEINYGGITLNPTAGSDGYSAQKINLFSYRLGTISSTLSDGIGGIGGVNDLGFTKEIYCLSYYDASNTLEGSTFWYNPKIELRTLKIEPVKSGRDAPSGKDAAPSFFAGDAIEGLDPNFLYLLKNRP